MNDRIRRAIARIDAGASRGTGTLVADGIVLTALHVVADRQSDPVTFYEGITLTFPDHVTKATPVEDRWDRHLDWVLLRLEATPPDVLPVPLAELTESGVEWTTYGFPDAQPKDGMVQSGSVKNHLGRLFGVPAYQLFSEEAAAGNGAPVSGLSGGPVIVDGGLVGVMRFALMKERQAVAGTLYACPTTVVAEAAETLLPIPDPCHGLPGLPHHPLPDRPFRYLKWFTANDAAIFFGRSRDIRLMYERLVDDEGASVVLLYGQSGVGKSSFLDAGLVPRLGWSHEVVYVRRDPSRSLLELLRSELARRAAGEDGAVPSWSGLDDLWRAAEERCGRPVIVFLDQIEEVYTRRRASSDDEMAELAAALAGLSPRGKLVLGFRKEWYPEVQKQLEGAAVDFARVFLEALDHESIVDAVTGLTRTRRTRERYGLEVDPALAEMIALDLLADPDAPVAPTLQILLTKLWERATARSATNPRFSVEGYLALRNEGFLLADFLEQQEASLRDEFSVEVDRGITLDVLARHTTPLLTSQQCETSELRHDYPHARFDALVDAMRERYLLVDAGVDDAGRTRATRLAHDTLAPCVRVAFEESSRPGQRARRILDGRAPEWEEGAEGRLLDEADLAIVEAGVVGTRLLNDVELRLLNESREARDRHARLVRIVKVAFAAAALLLAILLVVAISERRQAEANAIAAKHAERDARLKGRADEVLRLLETRPTDGLLVALYAAGQSAIDRDGDVPPPIQSSLERAMELARESCVVTFEEDADRAAGLRRTIAARAVAHHPTDPTFVCGLVDGTLHVQTESGQQVGPIVRAHEAPVTAVAYLGSGGRVVSVAEDGTARVWRDGEPAEPTIDRVPTQATSLAVAGDRWIAIGGANGVVYVVDVAGGSRREMKHAGPVNGIAFTDESPPRLVAAYENGDVVVWDVSSAAAGEPWRPHEKGTAVSCVDVARGHDGELRVATGGRDETVRLGLLDAKGRIVTDAPAMREHDAPVRCVAFRRGGRLIASASDRIVVISNLRSRVVAPRFTGPARHVSSIAFGEAGTLVVASEDGTARVRDPSGAQIGRAMQQGESPTMPVADPTPVVSIAFSSDGRLLATGGADGSLCLWSADAERLVRQIIPGGGILDIAFIREHGPESSDGSGAGEPDGAWLLLLACADGRIVAWRTDTYAIEPSFDAKLSARPRAVEVAANGRFVAGDESGTLAFFSVERDNEVGFVEVQAHDGPIRDLAFSSDGEYVVSVADDDPETKVWRFGGTEPIAKLHDWRQIDSVAITRGATAVITGSEDGFVLVRSLDGRSKGGKSVASLSSVHAITLSEDETRVVTGGDDGVVRLWRLDVEGQDLEQLAAMDWGHDLRVRAVAIHGDVFASGGADGESLLWRGSWREWFRLSVDRLKHHPSFADPDPTFDAALHAREFARERVWTIGGN